MLSATSKYKQTVNGCLWYILYLMRKVGLVHLQTLLPTLESSPREGIHFFRWVLETEGARWKVGVRHTLHWVGPKVLCQLHLSQWDSLDFATFPTRGCLRLFVLVAPSLGISKWGLVWQSTRGKWWLTHWASLLRWIWSISEYNLRHQVEANRQ